MDASAVGECRLSMLLQKSKQVGRLKKEEERAGRSSAVRAGSVTDSLLAVERDFGVHVLFSVPEACCRHCAGEPGSCPNKVGLLLKV